MIVFVTVIAALAAAAAKSNVIWTDRNVHNFTLEIDGDFRGAWTGDVEFTLSACPKVKCFHVSGPLKIPNNKGGLMEGAFSIPETDCTIHFIEVPHRGMDSGNFRVTPIASDEANKGCAYLPAGLPGLYWQQPGN